MSLFSNLSHLDTFALFQYSYVDAILPFVLFLISIQKKGLKSWQIYNVILLPPPCFESSCMIDSMTESSHNNDCIVYQGTETKIGCKKGNGTRAVLPVHIRTYVYGTN